MAQITNWANMQTLIFPKNSHITPEFPTKDLKFPFPFYHYQEILSKILSSSSK